MKIDSHPIIDETDRCFIQISEFSFTAYPVQINHVGRCLPDATSSPSQARDLWRSALSCISQWLRRACGKPTVAPAALTLPRERELGEPKSLSTVN